MAKKKIRKLNKTYKLPKRVDLSKTKVRVLSFDPGSRNFGIACVGVDSKDRIKVLANSIVTNPIFSLADKYPSSLRAYLQEIQLWVDLYKPQGFVMERFQTRGGMGPLIELVSVMLGAITTKYVDRPSKLITAATWKNSFHRRFDAWDLNDIYPQCLTTPHQLDASLIGVYGLEVGMQRELIYTPESFVDQVENTSLLPLRKPRN